MYLIKLLNKVSVFVIVIEEALDHHEFNSQIGGNHKTGQDIGSQ